MRLLSFVLLAALSSISASASSRRAANHGTTLVSGWYPGWHGSTWPPSKISWAKYNTMNFAFVQTTPDVHTLGMDEVSRSVLPNFVALAKKNNVKAIASIGGWTGSRYFSPAVSNAKNRTAFVKTIVDFTTKYKLDGVDFDWEYPSGSGLECNLVSAHDTANYLAFLQALRKDPVGKHLIVSGAVGLNPFNGPDSKPLANVSAFAKVFDYLSIMAYDMYGPWSKTAGPNAALFDSCAPPRQQVGSAQGAVKAWTSAGFPANKLSLGIAAYGHSFFANRTSTVDASGKLALYPPSSVLTPKGDRWDDVPGKDQCGTLISRPGGIFNFWGLIDAGFLDKNGQPHKGIFSRYDECTQTSYVYNKSSEVYISYDNPKSLAAKGKFVQKNGLKGVTMWTVAGDYDDLLINSVRGALKA